MLLANPNPNPNQEGLKQTVAWYMEREANWWECGTDSSLAAHPHAKGAHVTSK